MRDLRYIDALIEDENHQTHPSNEDLAKFIDEELDENKKEEILEHLISCDRCRDIVQSVFKDKQEVKKKGGKPVNNIYKKSIFPVMFLVAASLLIFAYIPKDDMSVWRAGSSDKIKIDKLKKQKIIDKILSKKFDYPNENYKKAKEYEKNGDLINAKKHYKITISDSNREIEDNRMRLEITIQLIYKIIELNRKTKEFQEVKKWEEKLEFRVIDYIKEK